VVVIHNDQLLCPIESHGRYTITVVAVFIKRFTLV